MAGVLEDPKARQDVLLRRGARTEWAIRWENSEDGGITFRVVELYASGKEARLRLLSPKGEVWLEKSAFITQEHLVLLTTTPEDFQDPIWRSRSGGAWVCDLFTPPYEVDTIRHGEGYFTLED